ncbi:MAG: DUF1059 domain-containing protein [Nitrosopumilaceae archaeon]
MAKKFACGDVVEGCAWSTSAENEEELFKKIAEHAKDTHNMTEIPDEILEKVKSKIADVS